MSGSFSINCTWGAAPDSNESPPTRHALLAAQADDLSVAPAVVAAALRLELTRALLRQDLSVNGRCRVLRVHRWVAWLAFVCPTLALKPVSKTQPKLCINNTARSRPPHTPTGIAHPARQLAVPAVAPRARHVDRVGLALADGGPAGAHELAVAAGWGGRACIRRVLRECV